MLTRHVPPPALRPHVAAAHGYRMAAMPAGLHRGLPSRHLTLVIELRGPLRVAGLGAAVAAHGVVGGLHTGPALIDASAPQEGLQYALEPLTAVRLLGVPAGALSGLATDLTDVLGTPGRHLVERVARADDWPERFALVDAALARRLTDAPPVDGALEAAWRMIFASHGQVAIADVAGRVGYSRRHLSERVRAATGVTPKQAARIARFEATCALLRHGRLSTVGEAAAACGYADQSHLAREWRALAGCTVTSWLRDELPFVQDAGAPAPS